MTIIITDKNSLNYKQGRIDERKELIEEIIMKSKSIETEEDLFAEEIKEVTIIRLLTEDWNKLKEKK